MGTNHNKLWKPCVVLNDVMPNKISLPQLERSSIEWRKKFRVCFGCITTLCDWLTNSRHFLNQWESKPKPIVFSPHAFSRAWRQLHVFASSSDWFVVLFTSVSIGQSNYFGFGFTHSKKKKQNALMTICLTSSLKASPTNGLDGSLSLLSSTFPSGLQ